MNTQIPEEALVRLRATAKAFGDASREVSEIITGPMPVMSGVLGAAMEKEQQCAREYDAAW